MNTRSAQKKKQQERQDESSYIDSREKKMLFKSDISKDHSEDSKKNKVIEFGGVYGTIFLMIWSHYILYYVWYCLTEASGSLIVPLTITDFNYHINNFIKLFAIKCIPSMTTWGAYASFFFFQLILARIVPGMLMHGIPIDDNGKRLPYLCNGYLCYYACLWGFFLMHNLPAPFDFYRATHLSEHYGEYITAAIVVADLTSIFWYIYGLYTSSKKELAELSGNHIYDFFMGSILYPRIGIVDIKMVAECRWSWLTLMLLTLSCATSQYQQLGYVSKEMGLMLLAHWLYSNATVKGEHYIPCTWDMFHEKFGWMLNFWNIAGVPYLYCFNSFYILKNQEAITKKSNTIVVAIIYFLLILGYYIFDSANSQKATIKLPGIKRNTFPQVPWGVLQQPIRYIYTPHGNLLVDGWYAFARKMQYTGDIMMALSWGLVCGFGSSLPYFYAFFFICMIVHRQSRDEVRCKMKYGEYWDLYTKEVPNVFIPNIPKLARYLLLGEGLATVAPPRNIEVASDTKKKTK